MNLIRLKQTAKQNTLDGSDNQKTAESTKTAIKRLDFSIDLPLPVDGTAGDIRIFNAITVLENVRIEDFFYPYRPHRYHLTTRIGLLFYNDEIVIPEEMTTSIIARLHKGHVAITKSKQAAEAFWWPGMLRKFREKSENCPS